LRGRFAAGTMGAMENPNIIPEELQARIAAHRAMQDGDKKRKWPKEIRSDILKLLESGVRAKDISLATAISRSQIATWVQKSKPKRRPADDTSSPAFSQLQISLQESCELHVCVGEATIYGFNRASVIKFLREAGFISR
jgi:transposase-like protein